MHTKHIDCLDSGTLSRILSALPASALAQAEATCKKWRDLAADSCLWQKCFIRSKAEHVSRIQTVPEEANCFASQHKWKQAYSALLTVRVWDKRNGKCKGTLKAPMTGAPYALHMLSQTLILVRYNTMLLLWNKTQMQRKFTFQHELVDSTVSGNLLFLSTLGSQSIETWDIYSGLQLRIFRPAQACNTIHLAAGVIDGAEVLLLGLQNAVCLLDQLTGQILSELVLGDPTQEHIVALDMHLDCTVTVLICGGASPTSYKRCNKATIGVGCPAFYTVEGLHKLVVEPRQAAGFKISQDRRREKVIWIDDDMSMPPWAAIQQDHSDKRIIVKYKQSSDVSFIFLGDILWKYNAALDTNMVGADDRFRPVSLLHGNLLLTTTRSNRLAVWYLPGFPQEVQLPMDA